MSWMCIYLYAYTLPWCIGVPSLYGYTKSADREPVFSSTSAQQDKRCYSQKSSSDGWLGSI